MAYVVHITGWYRTGSQATHVGAVDGGGKRSGMHRRGEAGTELGIGFRDGDAKQRASVFEAIKAAGGRLHQAAEALGVSKRSLYRWVKEDAELSTAVQLARDIRRADQAAL